jgi:hypothetical protein
MALTTSLICHYALEEASGNRLDSHTNGLTLTSNASVGQATGKVGSFAAQFNAASSRYLSRASESLLQTGDIDFTLAAWVYLDSKAAERTIASKWSGGTGNAWWWRYTFTGADRFSFAVRLADASTAQINASSFGSPSTATWYFVVAWHDATANTINIQVNNGTVDSSTYGSTTAAAVENGAFEIGQLGTAGQFMDGRIDSFSFWKRTLTSTERTTLYNSGAGLDYGSFASAGGSPAQYGRFFLVF